MLLLQKEILKIALNNFWGLVKLTLTLPATKLAKRWEPYPIQYDGCASTGVLLFYLSFTSRFTQNLNTIHNQLNFFLSSLKYSEIQKLVLHSVFKLLSHLVKGNLKDLKAAPCRIRTKVLWNNNQKLDRLRFFLVFWNAFSEHKEKL